MPSAWSKVLASLGAAYAGRTDAPALLGGTGKDQVHLLVVATGERGLAGGFNSSIARLARDDAKRLLSEGKTVKILTVGRKGNDILKRHVRRQDRRRRSRSAKCACSATSTPRASARRSSPMYRGRRVRRRDAVLCDASSR